LRESSNHGIGQLRQPAQPEPLHDLTGKLLSEAEWMKFNGMKLDAHIRKASSGKATKLFRIGYCPDSASMMLLLSGQ
jgi:hypothetical protein